MTLWLFVAARIVSNPISNVLQKLLMRCGANAFFVIVATFAGLALLCSPFLYFASSGANPGFWRDITISALLAVLSNATLVAALKESDLSVLGPINSYKAIVSLIPAIVMLGEIPTGFQIIGMLLIVFGSWMVLKTDVPHPGGQRNRFFLSKGVLLRFAALVLSAIEAVFLKRAIIAASPELGFLYWSILSLGWSLVLLPFLINKKKLKENVTILQENKLNYGLLILTTGVMQLSSLVTFKYLPVGPALALFQTSTLLTVLFGWTIFKEKHFLRRLLGATVMIGGAVMIIVKLP